MTSTTVLRTAVRDRIRPAAADPGPDLDRGVLTALPMLVLLTGAFLSILDFFVVNVALPTIGGELHASSGTLELVVAGYGIPYALGLVLGGRLGDTYGRRRMFLVGMALFTFWSLLCGLAPTAELLVVARVFQGVSSALMVPQVLGTIGATTTGRARVRALGFYGATAGMATILGQILGGVLVSANIGGTSWRPVFFINVPIGIAAFVLARCVVPVTRASTTAHIDVRGTLVLALALLALLVPLTEGESLGWPWWTWALLGVFPVALAAFALTERHVEVSGRLPVVPPSLIKVPSMRRGLLVVLPVFLTFGGFMFVYAVLVQEDLHWAPYKAGLGVAPAGVTFFAASLLSGRLLARWGRGLITRGALVAAVGMGLLVAAFTLDWTHNSVWTLLPGVAVFGIGQGMMASPLFGVVLSQVPADFSGSGSGILVTTQQAALALGAATFGTLFLAQQSAGALGAQAAAVLVIALIAAADLAIAVFSRGLPAV